MRKSTICVLVLLGQLGISLPVAVAGETVVEKLPIPNEAARNEALALVRDVYHDDFSGAKSLLRKAELAKKLLQEGIATKDSPAGKYALLLEARSLAVEANSGATALAAIDELAASFVIDALSMQVEVLQALAKLDANSKEIPLVIDSARRLSPMAIADDRSDIAESLLSAGLTAAKKSKNLAAAREFTVKIKEAQELQKEFEKVSEALTTLDDDPTDEKANRVVGRYRCLQKGEWTIGLPMLALADDKDLRRAAEADVACPETTEDQIAVGDLWWALAEKESEPYRTRVKARSGYWYEQGLPNLTGLTKARIEKQLKSIGALRAEGRVPANQTPPASGGAGNVVYLSDLVEASVEVLQYQGKAAISKGIVNAEHKILLGGKESPKAIIAHPKPNGRSKLVYDLSGKSFKHFEAVVGVDEARNRPGNPKASYQFSPLTFEVWADDKMLWRSAEFVPGSQPQACRVLLPELSLLQLIVNCKGHANYAWAIWFDPRVSSDIAAGTNAAPQVGAGVE